MFKNTGSVYPPPLLRGEDRLAGGRGGWGGGSIFWKTREIGLPSYSKICTLWFIYFSSGQDRLSKRGWWSILRSPFWPSRVVIIYNIFVTNLTLQRSQNENQTVHFFNWMCPHRLATWQTVVKGRLYLWICVWLSARALWSTYRLWWICETALLLQIAKYDLSYILGTEGY
jgi:hypothetical protein